MAACRVVGLVREMGSKAMSGKKQYWSKMNHSEAIAAVEMMRDEEAGRWLRGWLDGALGVELKDGAPMEWRLGWASGKQSLAGAQEFSRKQSERVSKRYTEATAVDPVEESLPDDTEATDEYHDVLPDLPINKQTNKENKNKEHKAPARDEWSAYAASNFPWWPRWDSDKAFAYWSTKDFTREGKRARSDWRRLMGTWAGKWAKENPRDVERHAAPIAQENGNRLPTGFRPLGKAPQV